MSAAGLVFSQPDQATTIVPKRAVLLKSKARPGYGLPFVADAHCSSLTSRTEAPAEAGLGVIAGYTRGS
jgi:hypothetical protein